MTSNRFFLESKNIHKSRAFLEGEEHHHLKNVARLGPGDRIWLFDESGVNYSAQVETVGQSQTGLLLLGSHEKPERRVEVILNQALVKSKNLELILQKATELGISAFQPVQTARSLIKAESVSDQRLLRWLKIAREAAKQSGIGAVPVVRPPKSFSQALEEARAPLKVFLHERRGKPLRDLLVFRQQNESPYRLPSTLIIMIGPEGGWTETEREQLESHSFVAVNLGRQILRTETAAISCLAMIDHFWNQ